jgi:mannitol/fructose-specific phosphotransferase system IIA component (Ntr-type)
MTSDDSNSSIASLLNLVKRLKQDSNRQHLSASEKEAKIFDVIAKLAKFKPLPAQAAPMTFGAEER